MQKVHEFFGKLFIDIILVLVALIALAHFCPQVITDIQCKLTTNNSFDYTACRILN